MWTKPKTLNQETLNLVHASMKGAPVSSVAYPDNRHLRPPDLGPSEEFVSELLRFGVAYKYVKKEVE